MRPSRPLAVAAALGLVVALSACSTSSESGDLEAFSIQGNWTLTSGSGPNGAVEPVEGSPITLEVDGQGTVHGSSGCNTYNSTATVEGNSVTFGPLMQTMMACEDAIMTAEYAYSTALEGVSEGSVEDGGLVLTGEGVELRYSPTERGRGSLLEPRGVLTPCPRRGGAERAVDAPLFDLG